MKNEKEEEEREFVCRLDRECKKNKEKMLRNCESCTEEIKASDIHSTGRSDIFFGLQTYYVVMIFPSPVCCLYRMRQTHIHE